MAYLDYEGLQHFKDKENEQVAPVESSNTSANAYEIGKYFWHEGNYCKAKTAIAVGDAFVQNTNYTIVKVGEEIEKKANTDGYYEAMTVGNAEQIVATEGVEDSTPYVFRKAGGGLAIGNREADTLVGGTVAWNQLAKNGNFADDTIWATQSNATKSIANNEATLTITSTQGSAQLYQFIKCDSTHKYLVAVNVKTNVSKTVYMRLGAITNSPSKNCTANEWNYIAGIKAANGLNSRGEAEFNIYAYDGVQGEVYNVRNAVCFDLTQMFGTTIADYIYSLEQANAGDGVAWFKNLFPNNYYAYDTGTLMSVNATSHVTTGFNQWDEQWESGAYAGETGLPIVDATRIRCKNAISVLPNTKYYAKSIKQLGVRYYDANDNFLGSDYNQVPQNSEFTTPSGASYMRFSVVDTTTYNHDICISFSSYRNGEYEAYESNSYPLDSELTIRGIPKLDSNDNLYYDGDIYEADGDVTRKYGIVDLGTLNWTKYNSNYSYFRNTNSALPFSRDTNKVICAKYPYVRGAGTATTGLLDKSLYIDWNNNGYLIISDSAYTNSSEFKDAMSGVYFVYELSTPTTEQAEPYAANQVVSGDGTEEYVDAGVQAGTRDVSVPVGHNTVYQQDLRNKIQDAPDSPSEDGDYIMRRTNGHNTYNKGNFAEVNGNYPNMTVGNAEQLVSTVGIDDKTPYNFRTSGGSIDIGDRETDMVVGGTIAWNQWLVHGNFDVMVGLQGLNGTLSVSNNEGVLIPDGSKSSTLNYGVRSYPVSSSKEGHVFYSTITCKSTQTDKFRIRSSNATKFSSTVSAGTWTEIDMISKATSDVNYTVYANDDTLYTTADRIYFKNWMVIDLTQMFGATIAEYIYNLEQTTSGAGLAWFKALFPKPYYEYNAGELISVNTSAHNMTGFNQWDEQWELGTIDANGNPVAASNMIRSKNYIPCLPSTAYHDTQYGNSSSNNIVVYFYDGDKKTIPYTGAGAYNNGFNGGNGNFITPANTRYMRLRLTSTYGTTYKNDICINLSWDGERDGEYEPYVEYNYPLDSSLELRGVTRLDSANNLYYDGDTYESDGTVTRRYKTITIDGTAPFADSAPTANPNGGYNAWFTYNGLGMSDAKLSGLIDNPKISDKFAYVPRKSTGQNNIPIWSFSGNVLGASSDGYAVFSFDSTYDTYDKIRTWFANNPTLVLYEIDVPDTEQAEPYQNPQIVDDFGTEEYVDYAESQGDRDVSVPVGHETTYSPNLRAKLETAPDSPQSDGDYIVRQTNGENQYVQLVIPQELPNTPGTDGTYQLQAVVSGGTATLSWVSAT